MHKDMSLVTLPSFFYKDTLTLSLCFIFRTKMAIVESTTQRLGTRRPSWSSWSEPEVT